MRLDDDACWTRLAASGHGVLCTVHADRGVDAVPVVFVVLDRSIVVPVDAVKAKVHTRLQRLANLALDPRCALLVEHYDDDWSKLWWVRLHGRGAEATPTAAAAHALAGRFPAYRRPHSIVTTIVVTPTAVAGWQAT